MRVLYLLVSLVACVQCRHLWSADLPQISDLTLEKGKPLQLPKPYKTVQIANLNGTLYSDSLSQLTGVEELRITQHELTSIEKGALCSAPDVKVLELDFYDSQHSLTHLTKEMFDNCDHLQELILKFNSEKPIYTIDQDAIEGLVSLTNFALQSYPLNHLTKNFLKISPTALKTLSIAVAELTQVDSDVLEDFINLEEVTIRHNRNWTSLPRNFLKNLPKLRVVSLRDNGLDLSWDEFEGLNRVKTLDVGSNRISSFSAEKVAKYLPNLDQLYIEINPLPCKQKEKFVEELRGLLGHYIEVEYKFDPGFYDSCEQEE